MQAKEARPLPIDAMRDDFFRWAKGRRPFVLQAPTGSGKSTRLPIWLQQAHGKCLVVEPRRMACASLASFLASQRGEKVGQQVGLCMRGVRAYGDDTQILFVTPGIAIRMFASRDPWTQCVLVDEFHERSTEMDLLLACLRTGAGRWGVTSATLAAAQWSQDWDAELLASEGRMFPVSCEHDAQWATPSRQNLEERICEALAAVLNAHQEGDILVFLPGMREIQSTMQASRHLLKQHQLTACMAHSTLGTAAIDALFEKSKQRRVYFATNVAETSVTFPNIRIVIDSGLEKRIVHRGGRAVLLMHGISAASAEQRKGRAGRVGPGHCHRLYRTAAALEPHTPPEIERTPLDDICSDAAACGLDLRANTAALWPTPPPAQAFEEAIARLQQSGMLDKNRRLTEQGLQCSRIPTSVQHASLLLQAPAADIQQLCALVALLDGGRGCLRPRPTETEQLARAETLGGLYEVEREVALFFVEEPKRLGIDGQRLDALRQVARELERHASSGAKNLPEPTSLRFSPTLLRQIMRRAPAFCFAKRERSAPRKSQGERAAYGNGLVELNCEREHFCDQDEPREFPTFSMVFQQRWQMQSEGRAPIGAGAWWVPTEPAWLMAEGIGTAVQAETEWPDKKKAPQIREETQLGGVTIGTQLRGLKSTELYPWVASELSRSVDLCEQGASPSKVWKSEIALAMQAAFRIWEAWSFCERQGKVPAWDDFVSSRLRELGVEEYADLDLLTLDDWLPDLAATCNIQDWEQEKWLADFPSRWKCEGGWFRCDLEGQEVVLRPTDAKSKKQKNIPAQLLPRFRGRAIFLQHASRKVRLR